MEMLPITAEFLAAANETELSHELFRYTSPAPTPKGLNRPSPGVKGSAGLGHEALPAGPRGHGLTPADLDT